MRSKRVHPYFYPDIHPRAGLHAETRAMHECLHASSFNQNTCMYAHKNAGKTYNEGRAFASQLALLMLTIRTPFPPPHLSLFHPPPPLLLCLLLQAAGGVVPGPGDTWLEFANVTHVELLLSRGAKVNFQGIFFVCASERVCPCQHACMYEDMDKSIPDGYVETGYNHAHILYAHTHTQTHTNTHPHTHIHTHKIHTHPNSFSLSHAHSQMYTLTHTHKHTHTHTRTYTNA